MRAIRGVLAATPFIMMIACSSSPEGRVARAAARLNASNSPRLESAHAEGRVLVVRLRSVPSGDFDEEDVRKEMMAGLCANDGFKKMLADGASIRFEIPHAWTYFTVNADHCDG